MVGIRGGKEVKGEGPRGGDMVIFKPGLRGVGPCQIDQRREGQVKKTVRSIHSNSSRQLGRQRIQIIAKNAPKKGLP